MAIQEKLWMNHIGRQTGLSIDDLSSRVKVNEIEGRILFKDLGVFVPLLRAEGAKRLIINDWGIIYISPQRRVEPYADSNKVVKIYTERDLRYWMVLRGWYGEEFHIENGSSSGLPPFGWVHLKFLNKNKELYIEYCGLTEKLLPCRLDDITPYPSMYSPPSCSQTNTLFDTKDIIL